MSDANGLITYLKSLGAKITWNAGKPALNFPASITPEEKAALAHALAEHREAVIAALEEPTYEGPCHECQNVVYIWRQDMDPVFECCKNLFCPFWNEGLGPEWFGKARAMAIYERLQKRKRMKDQSPIPE